ncbi:MAG: hypothetical protein A2821_02770 [Candidatus Magasanikbacteria bacterium RIFCSPHIGHO2_01_FULL_41_23]|nr:MAG: hypothetical protein A2821_02770 [Candidatus Magasanikbacteria bacterium RIFCSPHIGHO2_01_FULL_41_23]
MAEVGLTTNAILAISVEASGASVDENGTYIVPRLAGKADLAGLAKKSDLSGLATSSALTALGNEVDGNEAARKADAKAFRSAVYRASKRHATALAALPPPATTDLSGLATKQDVAEIRAAIDDARAQVVVTPAALPLPALPEAP